MTTLPEQIELHRDRMWRRDEDLRIESAIDAERFIEDVGFANTLIDARRAVHRSDIAECGRRHVILPRNGVSTGSDSDRVMPGASPTELQVSLLDRHEKLTVCGMTPT